MQIPKRRDLGPIIDKVKCPKKCMIEKDAMIFCTLERVVGKKTIKLTELGRFEDEIIEMCTVCKKTLGSNSKDEGIRIELLKVSPEMEVDCKIGGKKASVDDDCKNCPYFNKAKLRQIAKEKGDEFDLEQAGLPCSYPSIDPSFYSVKLNKKTIDDGKVELKKMMDAINKKK